jgi:5-methyltetrahydropteroyltriglutamate--homocysteine methyltransferase
VAQVHIDPPFHADHVGSLLRPPKLIETRYKWMRGEIPHAVLDELEDQCVREVVALQERVGLQSITDGEQRRSSWRDLLFETTDGFSQDRTPSDFTFTTFSGEKFQGMPVPMVIGKLRRRDALTCDAFEFLKPLTKRTPKATLPSPSVAHFFRGDRMLVGSPYTDRAAYLADVAAIYRQEIAELGAAGCTMVQIDDVPIAVLCDPRNQEVARARGEDPQELLDQYVEAHNQAVRDRPAGMTLAVHLCRGNQGHGQASGGYEPVADWLFGRMAADAYFLEYDTERAGGFEPLRFVPKDRTVVLGLMSTKTPELEPEDVLRRRIDEAAKFVDMERLCLSPQCGFASNFQIERLTLDDQERKLAHLVAVADKVWG